MDKICGLEANKIRKAYFSNKLPKLLEDIQAAGSYTKEDFDKLDLYLSSLKKENELLETRFSSFLPKLTETEPDLLLDELNSEQLTLDEAAELKKEEDNRRAATQMAAKMLKSLYFRYKDPNQKPPTNEELMDISFEMLSLEYYLLREKVYAERLYRKKIVEIERTGRQRKLAEECAKITVEYRNFALAEGLLEQAKELILLAKKRYHDNL